MNAAGLSLRGLDRIAISQSLRDSHEIKDAQPGLRQSPDNDKYRKSSRTAARVSLDSARRTT